MDERFKIPRTLDDPPLFFLWPFDEAMVVIVGTVFGAMMGKVMILVGLAVGIWGARSFARLKTEGGRGLLIRALYWYTPSDWWFPSLTPSHVREYVGG
jgi:conjugal transfer pilus assembly protein TraL